MGFANKILSAVITVLFTLLVLVTFGQVIFRYLIGYSLYWSEEAARYLFVWITFLGSAVALQKGVHIGFDVLLEEFPPKIRRWVLLSGDVSVIAFLLFLTYQGIQMARVNMIQQSPALELPMGLIMAAIPLGSALMAFFMMVGTIRRFRTNPASE